MKELERNFRKKTIVASIVCLIIGLVVCAVVFRDYLIFGDVQDLDTINPSEITEGYGRVTVYDVYDYYSYWTDSVGKEVKRDYFVAAGSDENYVYIGCELTGKKNDRAYDIMEALWEADENYEEIDFANFDYFTVKGKVEKIRGEDLQYFNEYVSQLAEYYGMSEAEAGEYFVPYVLIAPTVGDGDATSYLSAVVGIVLLIAAIVLVFDAFFGNPLREIKKFCKQTANEEFEMNKIDRFYQTTPQRYDVKVNDEYFLFTGSYRPQIFDTKDVIWFYKYVVTRKSYFITVGRDYYVRFRTANGKMLQCKTKKEEIDMAMNHFMYVMPDSIAGYSDDLERTYRNNRGQMIAEVSRRHDARNGNACMHEDNANYNTQE